MSTRKHTKTVFRIEVYGMWKSRRKWVGMGGDYATHDAAFKVIGMWREWATVFGEKAKCRIVRIVTTKEPV
jgi:hypothetical protein